MPWTPGRRRIETRWRTNIGLEKLVRMFFALRDYFNYRGKKGRFARSYKASFMGAAFQGGLPPTAISLLKSGDVLFVETLNSWMSWLVMYMTKSEISHVALYVGNHSIAHATLDGAAIEPIEVLYDEETRILPLISPIPDETRQLVLPYFKDELCGVPYGWRDVIKKATRIFLGRDWRYFRWSFLVDLIVVLLALDAPLILIYERMFFFWLLIPYLTVLLINRIMDKIKPLPFDQGTAKPHECLEILLDQGGELLFDAYELSRQQLEEENGNEGT